MGYLRSVKRLRLAKRLTAGALAAVLALESGCLSAYAAGDVSGPSDASRGPAGQPLPGGKTPPRLIQLPPNSSLEIKKGNAPVASLGGETRAASGQGQLSAIPSVEAEPHFSERSRAAHEFPSATAPVATAVAPEESRVADMGKVAEEERALQREFKTNSPPTDPYAAVRAEMEQRAALMRGGRPAAKSVPELADKVPAADRPETGAENAPVSFKLGHAARVLIQSVVIQIIGVQALDTAMPGMLEKVLHDYTIMSDIMVVFSLTCILGSILAPVFVDKFSLKKTYLATLIVRLISTGAIAGLVATNHITETWLYAIYAVKGFSGGASGSVEISLGPSVVGQENQHGQERYSAWTEICGDIAGIVVPIATGLAIRRWGFLPPLIAYPVSFSVAIALVACSLKIPQEIEDARLKRLAEQAQQRLAKRAVSSGRWARLVRLVGMIVAPFASFLKMFTNGARVVCTNPILLATLASFVGFQVLGDYLCRLWAPAYSLWMVGPGQEEWASSIAGDIAGATNIGCLTAGVWLLVQWVARRLFSWVKCVLTGTQGGAQAQLTLRDVNEKLRRSMLRWMFLSAVSLSAFTTFMFKFPTLGEAVSLPWWLDWASDMTVQAAALIPFGIAQTMATIKLTNYFDTRAPKADLADAKGVFQATLQAAIMAGLLVQKFLLKGKLPFGYKPVEGFSGISAEELFSWAALAMVPVMLGQLFLRARLSRQSAPASSRDKTPS